MNLIRSAALYLSVIAFSLTPASLHAQSDELLIAIADFPPGMIVDDANGRHSGHLVEHLRNLSEFIGRAPGVIAWPFSRARVNFSKGGADFTIAPAYPELKDTAWITNTPVYTQNLGLYSVAGRELPGTLNDLKGSSVVVIRGQHMGEIGEFIRDQANRVDIVSTNDHAQSIRVLRANRVDYMLAYDVSVNLELKQKPQPHLRVTRLVSIPFHLVVSRIKDPSGNLFHQLTSAHARLSQDSLYLAAMLEKGYVIRPTTIAELSAMKQAIRNDEAQNF